MRRSTMILKDEGSTKGLYIRCYAQDDKCWDDGIWYVIVSDSEEKIEQYVENIPWKQHPYSTYYVDKLYTNFVYDLTLATELDE